LELLTTAAVALVAVELGLRLLDGAIGFGAAFQVLLLTPEFYRPLRELGAHRHAAMEARPVVERINTVVGMTAASQGPRTSPAVPPQIHDASSAMSVVELTYYYPDAGAPALESINVSLPRGSRTAFVGPSGAGKSTLVQLLLRFLEPTTGAIYADGVPIANLPVEAWRSRVALVPQRPYLFDASALDNLRLARPDARVEEIRGAAELAGAAEFLRRLPQGYDTPLGERGARLSRGQVQRLAIARAFLKNAPLLILDEPTSALDPESERVVRDSLERLGDGRTVIIVAHRLNTVVTADQIVVLRAGKMVERGRHAELIGRNGLYASLVGTRGSALVA
jgi:ATP-binding cassette, subfamily C, bacterial CydD